MAATPPAARCAAAHAEDESLCEGLPTAVRVVDQHGAEQTGCVNHGSALLASLENATVYAGPAGVPGAAIEAYRRAGRRMPFDFLLHGRE
jgi:hypothetical protein